MKKILSFLLVFVMIMSIFIPYTSLASYEGEIKEFEAKDADYECELHFNSDEKDEDRLVFYNDNGYAFCHYEGTAEEWENIKVEIVNGDENGELPLYYYSETAPTEAGNYWRYVEGVPTAW